MEDIEIMINEMMETGRCQGHGGKCGGVGESCVVSTPPR